VRFAPLIDRHTELLMIGDRAKLGEQLFLSQ